MWSRVSEEGHLGPGLPGVGADVLQLQGFKEHGRGWFCAEETWEEGGLDDNCDLFLPLQEGRAGGDQERHIVCAGPLWSPISDSVKGKGGTGPECLPVPGAAPRTMPSHRHLQFT